MQNVSVNGASLTLDLSGAVWWAAERALILGDVHFEKGSALAAQGLRLPAYDTHANLKLIEELVAQYAPKRLIALGDSFHDPAAGTRFDAETKARLNALADKLVLHWVLGNHDPALPDWLRGDQHQELAIGPLVFRHEPTGALGELSGHLHPCARIRSPKNGRSFRRRAFIEDGSAMILPAFGAFTGSLNVLDEAFEGLMRSPFRAWMIGRERIVQAPGAKLIEDRSTYLAKRREGFKQPEA